jgi:hypothetical protein
MFGPFRAHAHVAVDEDADRFVPSWNLLMGVPFATLFIELGLQHFIHFIVFGIHTAALIALSAATRGRRRGALRLKTRFKIFFQIGIIPIGAAR